MRRTTAARCRATPALTREEEEEEVLRKRSITSGNWRGKEEEEEEFIEKFIQNFFRIVYAGATPSEKGLTHCRATLSRNAGRRRRRSG